MSFLALTTLALWRWVACSSSPDEFDTQVAKRISPGSNGLAYRQYRAHCDIGGCLSALTLILQLMMFVAQLIGKLRRQGGIACVTYASEYLDMESMSAALS